MDRTQGQTIRRCTFFTGIAVLVLGIALPFFQQAVLPAAFGIGVAVLWYAVVLVSAIVGISAVVVGLLRSTGRIVAASRVLLLVVGGVAVVLLLYQTASISWTALVGPSAVIVVPDDFAGEFSLTIDAPTAPSLATAGKEFIYEIPSDGRLRVDRGWIDLRFRFENGYVVPGGRYFVNLIRQSGAALRSEEFECDWATVGQGSGIACEIRPLDAKP